MKGTERRDGTMTSNLRGGVSRYSQEAKRLKGQKAEGSKGPKDHRPGLKKPGFHPRPPSKQRCRISADPSDARGSLGWVANATL